MPRKPRQTLRNYFGYGSLPSESHFGDLIESTLNMEDDGFSRSQENGIEIKLLGQQRRWISFFGTARREGPDWSIVTQEKTGNLQFVGIAGQSSPDGKIAAGSESAIVTMTPGGMVGVGRTPDPASPDFRLDIDGAIRSSGRFSDSVFVAADGSWQDLLEGLEGCHAYEVMAGTGLPGRKLGRYALLHAFAVNTFNPTGYFFNFLNRKKRIRVHQSWYRSRGDRLELRWFTDGKVDGKNHKYKLQIRSITKYEDEAKIQVSLTQLWFDPFMSQSLASPPASKSGK